MLVVLAFLITKLTKLLVDTFLLLMFLRSLGSWIPALDETNVMEFLIEVTEWIVAPVRSLFEIFEIDSPFLIDLPFFVTYIVLIILSLVI